MSIYKKFLIFAVGLLILLVGISSVFIEAVVIFVLVGLYLIVSAFYGDFRFFSKLAVKKAEKSKIPEMKSEKEVVAKNAISKTTVSNSKSKKNVSKKDTTPVVKKVKNTNSKKSLNRTNKGKKTSSATGNNPQKRKRSK